MILNSLLQNLFEDRKTCPRFPLVQLQFFLVVELRGPCATIGARVPTRGSVSC